MEDNTSDSLPPSQVGALIYSRAHSEFLSRFQSRLLSRTILREVVTLVSTAIEHSLPDAEVLVLCEQAFDDAQKQWHQSSEPSKPSVPMPAPSRPGPQFRVADPELFTGRDDKVPIRSFLLQLNNVFKLGGYPDDATKIFACVSFMKGPALLHATSFMDNKSKCTESWEAFSKALLDYYDDPDPTASIMRKINALKQGTKPIGPHVSEFAALAEGIAQLYPVQDICDMLLLSINRELRDLVLRTHPLPDNLSDFYALVRAKGNQMVRIHRLESAAANRIRPFARPSAPPVAPSSAAMPLGSRPPEPDVVPMQIDANRRRGPLTAAEREHRRVNNLCMRCAQEGHYARQCPLGTHVNAATIPGND